jgi:pyruvate dehydrogenase E2 component (dihydrolipoamide acetyltransferase)
MAVIEFHLPDIGEGLAEVELIKWLVAEGDTVEENQPVADVESDKAIVTMPAPASGRVVRFAVAEGRRIKVGELMMVIEGTTSARSSGDAGGHAAPSSASTPPAAGPAAAPASAPVAASPAVRKLAQELGVALDRVQGTGPRGRITPDDVQRAAQGAAASPAPSPAASPAAVAAHDPAQGGAVDYLPFRGVRRRIA